MYAKVIVDVPVLNTDQPFSYVIPEKFAGFLQKGMRVSVPFGNGNRLLQGFVIGFTETVDMEVSELKEIVEVLDLEPVLNDELLALSDYMKEQTFAYKITCLQTMLPSVFKASYEKFFEIAGELTEEEAALFAGKNQISATEALEKGLLNTFGRLREEGKVSVLYTLETKDKVKTTTYVKSQLSTEKATELLETLSKRGPKRRLLVEYLGNLKEELPLKEVYENGFNRTDLNYGKKEGWLSFVEKETYRDPFAHRTFEKSQPLPLTSEQNLAFEKINDARQRKNAEVFLLEGVTGSGKTEVYLQSIQKALENNQTALMLVPEIALTPQMVQRFKARFGDAVAVLHSALSFGERYDEWRKIQRGQAQVVVGARSAIFAPLENIGMIIIDEEHETSYKQGDNPRYHARDLALWRGRYHHCPVVLGSATPSLESRARAQKGVYTFLTLKQRPTTQALPEVTLVDLKEEAKRGNFSSFSTILKEKIAEKIAKKEQVVLLLNKRGYSSFVMCRDCGFVLPCPNCDISLTLHMDIRKMKCHYCGHEEDIPKICPSCQSREIRYYGTGTQKVEEELQQIFPDAKILRMDVDTTRRKGAHEKILDAFGTGKADILLGTQMIAKGLDYPNVTLVGVLNADTALNLPDFRSSEHTFQLLTQVAGRAGRGEKKGEVYIQTFNPENYALQLAKSHDYEGFYQKEMKLRHLGGYPPYYYTVQVTASHASEDMAAKVMFSFYKLLKENLSNQAVFIGPSPKAILRINNQYYYQLLIKYKKEDNLATTLKMIQNQTSELGFKGVKVAIDMEPLQFI